MNAIFNALWTEWKLAIGFLKEGRIQSLMIVSGVAIGVAVIVFITALIQGLQSNLIERTLGTQSHITLSAPEEKNIVWMPEAGTTHLFNEDQRAQRMRSINNWQDVITELDQMNEFKAVSPMVSGPALIQRGEAIKSVAVIGIQLERYQKILPLQDYLKLGQLRIGADDVLIGTELAKELGVKVGSKLRLDNGQDTVLVVNVAGIFELGVKELDARYIYLDLKRAQSFLDLTGGVTIIDLTIEDIFQADAVATKLQRLTGLKTQSWIQTNAQLVNAISAQSLSTNMIIVFVAISVAFGIASVLSISVVQRTREIGILRATGAKRAQILRVFLIQGGVFGLLGALLGIAMSYALVWSFNEFGPNLFYIPVEANLILWAIVLAMLTGFIAAALPARRAAALDPVEAIRHV